MKKPKNKIKFFAIALNGMFKELIERDLADGRYLKAENPTSYANCPEGRYYVRSEKERGMSHLYYHFDGMWIETKTLTPTIHANYDAMLFPNLSDKEWSILKSKVVYNKLSEQWKVYVDRHNNFLYGKRCNRHYFKFRKDYPRQNTRTFLTESRIVESPKQMSILESLKKYFDETPRSKVEEDWNATKDFDDVGITVDDFLKTQNDAKIEAEANIKKRDLGLDDI